MAGAGSHRITTDGLVVNIMKDCVVISDFMFMERIFTAEICKNGSMKLIGYDDLEYDLSMHEFGEPATAAVQLLETWQKNPIDFIQHVIFYMIDKRRLASDYAQHVLWIYYDRYEDDSRPKQIFKAIDDVISGRLSTRGKTWDAVVEMTRSILNKSAKDGLSTFATDLAARAMRDAVGVATGDENLTSVAKTARAAVGHFHTTRTVTKEDIEEFNAWQKQELAWQVRRFVDCLDAVQSKKPWPPLEDTR